MYIHQYVGEYFQQGLISIARDTGDARSLFAPTRLLRDAHGRVRLLKQGVSGTPMILKQAGTEGRVYVSKSTGQLGYVVRRTPTVRKHAAVRSRGGWVVKNLG